MFLYDTWFSFSKVSTTAVGHEFAASVKRDSCTFLLHFQ